MKIRLIAKTKHGRNRIKEHGEIFRVLEHPQLVKDREHWLFVQSVEQPNQHRWVRKQDDENFEFEVLEEFDSIEAEMEHRSALVSLICSAEGVL